MGCSSSNNTITPQIINQNKITPVKEVRKKTEIFPKQLRKSTIHVVAISSQKQNVPMQVKPSIKQSQKAIFVQSKPLEPICNVQRMKEMNQQNQPQQNNHHIQNNYDYQNALPLPFKKSQKLKPLKAKSKRGKKGYQPPLQKQLKRLYGFS